MSYKDIMTESFEGFEGDLLNLFALLDHLQQIEFHEPLIQIATEIAKNMPTNTQIFNIVQRNLGGLLRKNDDTIDLFFELFYYWCTNGQKYITTENPGLLIEVNYPLSD